MISYILYNGRKDALHRYVYDSRILTSSFSHLLISATSSSDPITNAVPCEEVVGTYRSFHFSDFVLHTDKSISHSNMDKSKDNSSARPKGKLIKRRSSLSL